MSRSVVLVVVALVACRPDKEGAATRPSPALPADAGAGDPAAVAHSSAGPKPAPEPSAPPPVADPAIADVDGLCLALCSERNQMQARGAAAIEAECQRSCAARPADPDPSCVAAAAALRRRVERKAMPRRASILWAGLADANLHCGHHDATLRELARAGARPDLDQREAALAEVLRADPHLHHTCPGGRPVLDAIVGLDTRLANVHLIEHCPLEGESPGHAIFSDLRPMSFLGLLTVARRWKAVGATSTDHTILLEILRLASALEGEAFRRR